MRVLGDDSFYVRVRLDEQGREMITSCLFLDYNQETDEDKETLYDDLNGKEYKDMEVDREKGTVTVTYIDGEEEKTKEFEIE